MVNKPEHLIFSIDAFNDFCLWLKNNTSLYDKLNTLLNDCIRNPFSGLGKPEPLKGNYKGCYSRRINQEHRLIYFVTAQGVHIVACKYHYND